MNDRMLESIKEDVEYISKYIEEAEVALTSLERDTIYRQCNKIIGKLEMLDILLGDLK